jgi:hypothetical protein
MASPLLPGSSLLWTAVPFQLPILQCQRYFTTSDLLPISMVFATSPLRPTIRIFIFQLNTCGYSAYITSSPTRGWVCCLQLLLVLASAVLLRSQSSGTHDRNLLSQIRDSPNMEGQIPVFISTRNNVARLYPQALASLYVTSYDSQGYGRGMRLRFHMGLPILLWVWVICQDWRSVGKSVLGTKHSSVAYDQILITVRHLWVC